MPTEVWYEITYQWKLIINFTPLFIMDVVTFPWSIFFTGSWVLIKSVNLLKSRHEMSNELICYITKSEEYKIYYS